MLVKELLNRLGAANSDAEIAVTDGGADSGVAGVFAYRGDLYLDDCDSTKNIMMRSSNVGELKRVVEGLIERNELTADGKVYYSVFGSNFICASEVDVTSTYFCIE